MAHCKVYLPSKARVADVADVLAILTWAKPTINQLTTKEFYVTVDSGIHISSDYSPNAATIIWKIYGGKGKKYSKFFFFEYGDGFHGMNFSSTDIGIVIAKRLVDFFGGKVIYKEGDVGKIKANYARPVRPDLCETDGKLYQALQERKRKLKPITQKEIEAARPDSHCFQIYETKTTLSEKPSEISYIF